MKKAGRRRPVEAETVKPDPTSCIVSATADRDRLA